ncbi:molybdopterin cofactor-binding domain-containing protein [Archangium lansingense]|uniref:Molybdopterin-dependent oxidoreductase n=1 Tax=Archangium lansingense TaxID=2995310 RepID=A0ABT3ZYJ6_9BACT|nr:molybdopterin cofactor-binding domain-containing protein [Archangium lansinium]MCY1074470.1 molybdopterin-dependent oxidoreductase [Archangium lansinium]
MSNPVSFFLNGQAVTIEDPSPDLLLIDFLRSPEVGLAGPKKPCGQGGCGGCTVILSHWNEDEGQAEHRAINSCLRPVCSLGGLVVTTVEGTGAARRPNPEHLTHSLTFGRSAAPPQTPPPAVLEAQHQAEAKRMAVLKKAGAAVATAASPSVRLRDEMADHPSELSHEGMNPVAHRLAMNNGTQCGYCTVGFVMNMSEFIANNPRATKREIEDALDGNLCRCTGYRSILTGMKTFASNWTAEDEKNRMKCLPDDEALSQKPASSVVIPFPPEAQTPAQGVSVDDGQRIWRTPATLAELAQLMREHRGSRLRLVYANTSYGIYPEEYLAAQVLLDIRLIPELNAAPVVTEEGLRIGAGITYSELLTVLESVMRERGELSAGPDNELQYKATTRLGAAHFMARRTAGRIVRNAASLGGNSMLVLKHITGKSEPFPSDIFSALAAIEAEVEYLDTRSTKDSSLRRSTVEKLVALVQEEPELIDALVLVAYHLPYGSSGEVVLPQKVALREVNAHSIVNATSRFGLSDDFTVETAVLVFGGIAPFPWRARQTEEKLLGKRLALTDMPELASVLEKEVRAELQRWAERMKGLPTEGFTNEYRVQLAISFLYKAVVNALVERHAPVPEPVRSSGEITWGRWPVSDGKQSYKSQSFKKPVSQPYIKYMAMEQASGQIHYAHELPVPPLTVNAAFVQSRRALASWNFVIPGQNGAVSAGALREHLSEYSASFVDLITSENIKDGGINLQGMGSDQPLFAVKQVEYVGQSLALVSADTEQEAFRLADYVTSQCVAYGPVEVSECSPAWWSKPVLGLDEAIRLNSIFPDWPSAAPFISHIWKITRPGSRFDWANVGKDPLDKSIVNRKAVLDGVPCQVVEGTQATGGQVHFYMEPQAAVAEPADGRRLIMRPSTQSPMEMHQTVASALGVQHNRIDVQVPPVGGGFGGKTEQARFVVGAAAVAAHAMKRPVRLTLTREQDTAMIGKRHAYYGQYQVAIDRGELNPADRGLIRGFLNRMWGDGGAFYDCSFIVSNCIQTRADNAYRIPNFENQIDVCRTNTAPSTAFRSFGDVQAKVITESALDDAAFSVGMTAEEVREKNLYVRGDVTPFGQALSYCYIRQVWDYLKQVCKYEQKRQEVEAFNAANRWRKRGLAMLPVKYGSGYNLAQLEQATAVVSIFQADGSIVIHQGGVEMGQGLLTLVRQIAAYILNVPMEMIHVEGPRTSVTPNPSSTGGSTGTAYNGEAVKRVCEQLRGRLAEFAYSMRDENGGDWCTANGIDFWNFSETGWNTEVTINGQKSLIWQKLVQLAYSKRIGLVASFTAPIPGGTTPMPALTFKTHEQQPVIPGYTSDPNFSGGGFDSFVGFTYSAACSVTEVDVLTGEVKVISSDIVYDMGWSLNPAIDIGQVEGAFVQGLGYVLSEKLEFEQDGEDVGRLNTLNTWRYKPPAVTSIPLEMNVHLFPRDLAGVPISPTDGVLSSKEVGEPPLVLATSAFLATKAAIRASRLERGLAGLFRFDAPATVQQVRTACEVSAKDLAL